MRAFGRIESGFWQNPKVKALTERGRLLLAYLLSCPHGNSIGCYVLPAGYVMADLGWDETTANTHIKELIEHRRIERDASTGLTLIRGWWGHNRIENKNVAIAAGKQIAMLPQTSPVMASFYKTLLAREKDFGTAVWPEIKKAIPDDFETVTQTVTATVTQTVSQPLPELFANGMANPIETKEIEPEPEPIKTIAKAIDAERVAESSPAQDQPPSPFGKSLDYLVRTTGKSAQQCRQVIGRWRKGSSDAAIIDAVTRAQIAGAIEPVGFITKILSLTTGPEPPTDPNRYRHGGL
jgi:hypothetical protein